MIAVVALIVITSGAASRAWCESLWVAFQAGPGIESYTSAQLKTSGMPSPVQLSTFDTVFGVAFDKSHGLWATVGHFEVVRFTAHQLKNLRNNPNPNPAVTITSTSTFNNLIGCSFDHQGNLWVVDVGNDSIDELTKEQLAAGSGDITLTVVVTMPDLQDPNFVTFDRAGNAWVDDEGDTAIAKFSANQLKSSGTKTARVLLSDDGSGTSLSTPGEIVFDRKGNLWVANFSSNTVVEYGKSQLASSGSPPPKVKLSSAIFNGPFGSAFDDKGDLVVMNINDGTISKFTPKQLKVSGSPIPNVAVTGTADDYQITFGPAF